MKRIIVGITAATLLAVPATASAGNAYGKNAQDCVVSSKNLGQALKNGSAVHGFKITPAAFAASPHCG